MCLHFISDLSYTLLLRSNFLKTKNKSSRLQTFNCLGHSPLSKQQSPTTFSVKLYSFSKTQCHLRNMTQALERELHQLNSCFSHVSIITGNFFPRGALAAAKVASVGVLGSVRPVDGMGSRIPGILRAESASGVPFQPPIQEIEE